MTINNN